MDAALTQAGICHAPSSPCGDSIQLDPTIFGPIGKKPHAGERRLEWATFVASMSSALIPLVQPTLHTIAGEKSPQRIGIETEIQIVTSRLLVPSSWREKRKNANPRPNMAFHHSGYLTRNLHVYEYTPAVLSRASSMDDVSKLGSPRWRSPACA